MVEMKELTESDLDLAYGGMSSDPEWRYVPVRRTAAAASTEIDALFRPEIDDEVLT